MGILSGNFFLRNYRYKVIMAGALVLGVEAVALAALPNSFEIEGDQKQTTGIDWQGIPFDDLNQKLDCSYLGTTAGCLGGKDDAFKGGVKEADTPGFSTPGIPAKDDLTRFMVHSEVVSVDSKQNVFLNLAFERHAPSEQNGDANIDFEINQGVINSNGVSKRELKDVLVAFNYSEGSESPSTIYLLEWIKPTNSALECAITGNEAPPNCWGNCRRILGDIEEQLEPNCIHAGDGQFAAASVNLTTLSGEEDPSETAPLSEGGAGPTLLPLQFGEMSINLTAAGIVKENECKPFSAGYIKSRASTSINSQLKDVIKSTPLDLSICKTIRITKTDDETPGNPLGGAEFEIYKNVNQATCDVTEDVTNGEPKVGSCTTASADGQCSVPGLLPGAYCVYESKAPQGYDFSSLRIKPVSAQGDLLTFDVTFVDPRLYKVIVLVCREDTDELHKSLYTLGAASEVETLGSGEIDVADADLCSLDGDTGYKVQNDGTTKDLTVFIEPTPI